MPACCLGPCKLLEEAAPNSERHQILSRRALFWWPQRTVEPPRIRIFGTTTSYGFKTQRKQ